VVQSSETMVTALSKMVLVLFVETIEDQTGCRVSKMVVVVVDYGLAYQLHKICEKIIMGVTGGSRH